MFVPSNCGGFGFPVNQSHTGSYKLRCFVILVSCFGKGRKPENKERFLVWKVMFFQSRIKGESRNIKNKVLIYIPKDNLRDLILSHVFPTSFKGNLQESMKRPKERKPQQEFIPADFP